MTEWVEARRIKGLQLSVSTSAPSASSPPPLPPRPPVETAVGPPPLPVQPGTQSTDQPARTSSVDEAIGRTKAAAVQAGKAAVEYLQSEAVQSRWAGAQMRWRSFTQGRPLAPHQKLLFIAAAIFFFIGLLSVLAISANRRSSDRTQVDDSTDMSATEGAEGSETQQRNKIAKYEHLEYEGTLSRRNAIQSDLTRFKSMDEMIAGYGQPEQLVRSQRRSNLCFIAWKRWSKDGWEYLTITFAEPLQGSSPVLVINAMVVKDVKRAMRAFDKATTE